MAKVALKSEALRDLVACDYLALDGLVALVWSLADSAILLPRLVEMCHELVYLARLQQLQQLGKRLVRSLELLL